MGNFKSNTNDSLKFERILDAENDIYIGIGSACKDKTVQAIRIGKYNNYHRLNYFKESENKLKYEFENDIILILKKEDSNIEFNLVSLNNNTIITKNIDPIIIKFFKPINFASYEFDKIYDMFKKFV